MEKTTRSNSMILGVCLIIGLGLLGYLLGSSAIKVKEYERTVQVKGLSEREQPADIIIWPIQFTVAENDLSQLYNKLDVQSSKIRAFLVDHSIPAAEISDSTTAITDKLAQNYGGNGRAEFRYLAKKAVTVYSKNIDQVHAAMAELSALGKSGITLTGNEYESQTEYIFTSLNTLKPAMIEEATRNARQVAEKFASDSQSSLGKIKTASQGRFSISDRDKNNPHIKKIRVVSTVEYYLSD